jgi:transcriptional regulator with XRE-family HTH domain
MAQVAVLVNQLKRCLKAQGMTYADIARALELSESSVKRMFSRRSFSLERLEQICSVAGLEISDLVDLMNEQRDYLTELTPEQEQALVESPKLLLTTYLLINGWQLEQIVANYRIDELEAQHLLVRLQRLRIIELKPLNRVKLLTARNFTWRKNGPIQKLFAGQVQREFLDSTFSSNGERLRFVGGMLSTTGLTQMQQAIDRVAREFDELSRRDSILPLSERYGCSAVFAMRPWEFSVFAELRRKP